MSEIDPRTSRLSAAITDSDQMKDTNGVLPGNETLVRALLDTVPALMWSASPSGEPSYINQRVVDYTGRSLKDFVNLGWVELIHPEDLDETIQAWSYAVQTGSSYHVRHRLRRADGEYRWFLVQGEPFRDAEGRVAQFFGLNVDITEQEQLSMASRTSEKELQQVLDLLPQLVAVFGPERKRLYTNRMTLAYLGLSLDDWRHGRIESDIHPDDVDRVKTYSERASMSGMAYELEARMHSSDGRYRWFLLRYNPLRDERGQVIRWYCTCTDIDERKRAEERLQQENVALREEIDKASMFEEIVGTSPPLIAVLSRVTKVAASDSTILITGETGTGKELIARAIHRRSPRSFKVFVAVNCAAIPRELVVSELFGHEKGAFTGATHRRLGRFELADGGTIFLDEVSELLPDTQAALLRVLQEREFERIGGSEAVRVNVRVIAATNRDLVRAVAEGSFRRDLFYRLNVFPVELPPLRERREDIPQLVEYFVERYAQKTGKSFQRINRRTLDHLQSYPWPGNVRELQNVIERSVIVCDSEEFKIDDSWLSAGSTVESPIALSSTLASHERAIIEEALNACGGRVFGPKGAAAWLGIPRSTLESKIRALKIDKRRFRHHPMEI
jgi:formate hydrogenlyase transcriptional activator